MRAVVTGGAGFLGSHLLRTAARGRWDVLAFDNLVTGVDSNVEHLIKQPKFRIARADVQITSTWLARWKYVAAFRFTGQPR